MKIIKGRNFICSSVYQEYDIENALINEKVLITFNSHFEYTSKKGRKKLFNLIGLPLKGSVVSF